MSRCLLVTYDLCIRRLTQIISQLLPKLLASTLNFLLKWFSHFFRTNVTIVTMQTTGDWLCVQNPFRNSNKAVLGSISANGFAIYRKLLCFNRQMKLWLHVYCIDIAISPNCLTESESPSVRALAKHWQSIDWIMEKHYIILYRDDKIEEIDVHWERSEHWVDRIVRNSRCNSWRLLLVMWNRNAVSTAATQQPHYRPTIALF